MLLQMPLHVGDQIDLILVAEPLLRPVVEPQTQQAKEAEKDDGDDTAWIQKSWQLVRASTLF